jgi:hypothetical protein
VKAKGYFPAAPVAESQSLTVLSPDADASSLPPGENATAQTGSEWPRACGAPLPSLSINEISLKLLMGRDIDWITRSIYAKRIGLFQKFRNVMQGVTNSARLSRLHFDLFFKYYLNSISSIISAWKYLFWCKPPGF